MGIDYVDSVIVYNRYETRTDESEQYFGTRFDNVRVELTEGENIAKSGLESADTCLVKIPKTAQLKPYISSKVWEKQTTEEMLKSFTLNKCEDFFVIVKRKGLNIDLNLPEGMIDSDIYPGGFFEYVKNKYGYAYTVDSVNDYNSALYEPRFEIGGK